MKDIMRFKKFNELKKIYRACSVEGRKESSAEHSWSCLMLADYFLTLMDTELDRVKVYELLMYHDLIEIYSGDTALDPSINRKGKQEREFKAMDKLKKDIPKSLKDKFIALFKEFENLKTKEAKFARAIDQLDAIIQEIDYKEDWKGWSREFLIEKKIKFFDEFTEVREMFMKLVDYLEKKGYFNQ
ncbi:MAG: HD domain-containing protein [Nanoarchaeota archaeon]|nr:HD domain-containing protein [Nanoarchaeota archaeon]